MKTVEGKVILLIPNILNGNIEVFCLTVTRLLRVTDFPLRHHVWQFAARNALSFVIKGEAIILDLVEPGVLCPAASGEDKYRSGHSSVGFENAAGQGDDGL